MRSDPVPVVLVTGFGPFGRHTTNPSWESVKMLHTLNLEKEFNVRLVTDEIPVQYDYVSTYLCKKWDELKPHLVVHCGVSHLAQEVTLEQRAYGSGYFKEDVEGCCPLGGVCKLINSGASNSINQHVASNGNEHMNGDGRGDDESGVLVSGLDMGLVSRNVNASGAPCLAVVSNNAGRYLCEFTYYSSLCRDSKRTAFIHVPMLEVYPAKDIALTIKSCIREMLKQLDEDGNNSNQGEACENEL